MHTPTPSSAQLFSTENRTKRRQIVQALAEVCSPPSGELKTATDMSTLTGPPRLNQRGLVRCKIGLSVDIDFLYRIVKPNLDIAFDFKWFWSQLPLVSLAMKAAEQ